MFPKGHIYDKIFHCG